MRWGILLLLLSTSPANAAVGCIGDDSEDCRWTWVDYSLQATASALVLADWSQTSWGQRHGGMELNPILGRHPNGTATAGYFGGLLALHAGVAALLPKPYRTIWQSIWIGLEGHATLKNARLGIGFAFP